VRSIHTTEDGEYVISAQPGTWIWSVHGEPNAAKRYAGRVPVIGWLVQTTSEGTDGDWTTRRYLTEAVTAGGRGTQRCQDLYSTFIEMPDGLCYSGGDDELHLNVAEALTSYHCEWPEHLPRKTP